MMIGTLYLIMAVVTVCIIALIFIYPDIFNDTGYKLFAIVIIGIWIIAVFSIFIYLDRTMTKYDIISAIVNIVAVLSSMLGIVTSIHIKKGKPYILKLIVVLLCGINIGIAAIVS